MLDASTQRPILNRSEFGAKKRLIDQEGLPEEDGSTNSQIPVKSLRAFFCFLQWDRYCAIAVSEEAFSANAKVARHEGAHQGIY